MTRGRVEQDLVMPTATWRELHDPHRPPGVEYAREDAGHPRGTWIRLRCPCGAAHTTTRAKAGDTLRKLYPDREGQ